MKPMTMIKIKYLLLGLLTFSVLTLSAQQDSLQFPQDWLGEWEGDLVISSVKGEQMRVPMILRIQPIDDRYTYTIVYGEDTPENTRGYFLQDVADSPGHYQVDEDNGIILDDFLLGGKLYSRFEVQGSLLLSTLEEMNGQLIYEIISGPLEPLAMTGDTIINDEEIPPVGSYAIRVQQRAVLTKKQ